MCNYTFSASSFWKHSTLEKMKFGSESPNVILFQNNLFFKRGSSDLVLGTKKDFVENTLLYLL